MSTQQIFLRITLFFLFVMIGCANPSPARTKQPKSEGGKLLKRAEKEYLKGESIEGSNLKNLKKAFRLARSYIQKNPEGNEVAEAWFRIAQVQFLLRNYRKTLSALENGLNRDARPPVRAALMKWKGRTLWKMNRLRGALKQFRQTRDYINNHPKGSNWVNRANLLNLLAEAQIRMGMFQKGRESLQKVQNEYGTTPAAKSAEKKLAYIQKFFAVQMGAFEQKKNAKECLRELRRNGLDSYLSTVNHSSKTLHCVRIGKYKTYQQAKRKMEQLQKTNYDPIIVP